MDNPGTPALPDEVPAVNHAGGIARLMGDGALFARVLARFRNEYRQAAGGVREALERGDVALALRLVHTLKGAAGMIEAVPLRREAQALEHMLRHGGGDPYPVLQRLQDELGRVLRELDVLAGNLAERPAALSAQADADHGDAAARLTTLLDEGNGEAVDLVRDAAATLVAQLGETVYRAVAELVEAFDFDGALALLRARAAGD